MSSVSDPFGGMEYDIAVFQPFTSVIRSMSFLFLRLFYWCICTLKNLSTNPVRSQGIHFYHFGIELFIV